MAVVAACTDKGAKRSVNQDACCIQEAQTSFGEILMAVVCDGVGGLSAGELASATVAYRFVLVDGPGNQRLALRRFLLPPDGIEITQNDHRFPCVHTLNDALDTCGQLVQVAEELPRAFIQRHKSPLVSCRH